LGVQQPYIQTQNHVAKRNLKQINKAALAPLVIPTTDNEATENDNTALPAWFVYLQENNMIDVETLEEFSWDKLLTRASATPLLVAYAEKAGMTKDTTAACDFPDIADQTADMQETILAACQYGLLRWSNGNFMPNRQMLSYEMLVTLVRSKVWYLDETIDPWYANYFTQAQSLNMLDASDTVDTYASGFVQKSKMAQWIYRLLK